MTRHEYRTIFGELANKLYKFMFSRWRGISLYLVFARISLSGWYIDVAGWFSSSENYAASIRAQFGDINILNVITFFIGSLVFVVYIWADIKNKRLEKMIAGEVNVKNNSKFGDANQAVTTRENSQGMTQDERWQIRPTYHSNC